MPLVRHTDPIRVPDAPLFRGCSVRQLRELSRLGTTRAVDAGTTLTPEGELGTEFFVIGNGEAVCSVKGTSMARFNPGHFFGEMALLDGGPRTATVQAESSMQLWVYSADEFQAMLDCSPAIRHRLLVEMARRLRHADAAA